MTYDRTAAWLRNRLPFAAVAGAAVWLTWGVSLWLGGGLYDAGGQLVGADHLAFYSAARLWADGEMVRMYDAEFLQRYQRGLVGDRWGDRLELMRNPPHYALAFAPTCRLPYAASFWVCAGVYVLAAVVAARVLKPAGDRASALWVFTFYPVFAAVSYGQNGTLSLLVLALVWRALAGGRTFAAGAAAGLLLYKPQLLTGLLLWWLLDAKTYRAAWAGFLGVAAATAAVSFALMPDATWHYVTEFRTIAGYGGFGLWNMHNPRAFAEMLLPGVPKAALALAAVCSLAGLAAFVWLWWRQPDPAARFAAAVFLALWVSPHTPLYDWSIAAAAALVLWDHFPDRRAAWLTLIAVVWAVLAVSTPLAKWQVDHLPFAVQVSVPVLGVVGCLMTRTLARGIDSGPAGGDHR